MPLHVSIILDVNSMAPSSLHKEQSYDIGVPNNIMT